MSTSRQDKPQGGGDDLQVKIKKSDEEIQQLELQLEAVSALASKVDGPTLPSQVVAIFSELLDSLVVDVAAECHRAAKLGLDNSSVIEDMGETMREAAQNAGEQTSTAAALGPPPGVPPASATGVDGTKYTVDIFGQTHPPVATESFDCHNCGRPIAAGRYAPHLEKCMGKGRNASRVASRNISATQLRRQRASPIPSALAGSAGAAPVPNRTPNRTPTLTPEGSARNDMDFDRNTSEESLDDEVKDFSYGPGAPGIPQQRRGGAGAPAAGGMAAGLGPGPAGKSAAAGQAPGVQQGSAAAGCPAPGRLTGARTGKRGANKKSGEASADGGQQKGAPPSSRIGQHSGATLATGLHEVTAGEAKAGPEGQVAELELPTVEPSSVTNGMFSPGKLPQAGRCRGKKGSRNGEIVRKTADAGAAPTKDGSQVHEPAAELPSAERAEPSHDGEVAEAGPPSKEGNPLGSPARQESTKPRSRASAGRTGVKRRTSPILTRSLSLSEGAGGGPPKSAAPPTPVSSGRGCKEPRKSREGGSPEVVFNPGWAGSEPDTPMAMKGPRAGKGGPASATARSSGTNQGNQDSKPVGAKTLTLTLRSSKAEPSPCADPGDLPNSRQDPESSVGGSINSKARVWVGRSSLRQAAAAPGEKVGTLHGSGGPETDQADSKTEVGKVMNGYHLAGQKSPTPMAGFEKRIVLPGDEQGRKRQRPPPRSKPCSSVGPAG